MKASSCRHKIVAIFEPAADADTCESKIYYSSNKFKISKVKPEETL